MNVGSICNDLNQHFVMIAFDLFACLLLLTCQMCDWEGIKTKWDGSNTEYLKLDYGLLEVRGMGMAWGGGGGGAKEQAGNAKNVGD
jgi:hypothetical protein